MTLRDIVDVVAGRKDPLLKRLQRLRKLKASKMLNSREVCTITAGFWNTIVERALREPRDTPPARLGEPFVVPEGHITWELGSPRKGMTDEEVREQLGDGHVFGAREWLEWFVDAFETDAFRTRYRETDLASYTFYVEGYGYQMAGRKAYATQEIFRVRVSGHGSGALWTVGADSLGKLDRGKVHRLAGGQHVFPRAA